MNLPGSELHLAKITKYYYSNNSLTGLKFINKN